MVFICYIYVPENLYLNLPSAPLMSQEVSTLRQSGNIIKTLWILRTNIMKSNGNNQNADNKLVHASTGASSVGVISGISTTGTTFTVVGIPISVSLGVVSTVSTCVGGILLLASKKYKKKLLKCCELIDKITSSLATFEVLISLGLNDDGIIDAKEFHKLQAVYLQVMTDVRNVDRKMKVQTEENFRKNYSG